MIEAIVSFILGCVVAHLYYRQAKKDADKGVETQLLFLRNLLSAFEQQGVLRLERDPKGEITGAVLAQKHASDVAALTLGETVSVLRLDADDKR